MDFFEIDKIELKVFDCTNCGAELKYKAGTTLLICEYCNAKNEIIIQETVVEELDFEKYIEKLETENLQSEKVIQCKSCGSTSSVDESLKSLYCAYCSSPLVENDIHEERYIKPSYLLPFNIDNQKVYDLLSKWIDGIWFAPNNLKKAVLSPIGLRGVYVPYWTYDVKTNSDYTGQKGEYYEVTEGSGENQTIKRKTKWYSTSGSVSLFFDDIMIPASGNIDAGSLTKLEPWDTKALVLANDQYLSGFITEKYKVNLKDGFLYAKRIMDDRINQAVKSDIGGDDQSVESIDTNYSNIQFKHILLPVYVSSYRYENKVYHFYVNGRNGKLVGDRPYSQIKIILIVISILLLILLFLIFFG